ncbi:MAG: insulinase family protein [Flavobacteriales bacterium]|nr:insulinase family protein [Flavobacteriales bacterium]
MKRVVIVLIAIMIVSFGYAQNSGVENTGSAIPQPVLIEKVEAQEGKNIIPYEKWQLPNGLTIIIHEDHSDPLAHVEVRYHVGSGRETAGKSGFAHFFEHMMFQGSENVGDDEHFKIISTVGGTMNGYTTNDNTVYFETVPMNSLETALWLEADRMGFLLDSVTQEKFEVQRKTVKNEKAQNQINQPYGLSAELMGQNMYPAGHPYSWPVIGYVDDLDRADVDDLKNFFLRWYGPNNAILSVGGDVNTKEVLDLAMKYFGPIKRGAEVKKKRVALPVIADDKYSNSKDDVFLPLTQMAFPAVPKFHRDETALHLLASILGDGNNSIFYKNFVKSERAAQIFVFNNTLELAGEFTIGILAYPRLKDGTVVSFNDTEDLIRKTLTEFEKADITDEQLERAKAISYANLIGQTGSVAGKIGMISEWYMLTGKSYNVQDEINRYQRVTQEDLIRVYNRYVKGRNAVFVNVWPLPQGEDRKKFKKESFNPNATLQIGEEPEYAGLKYNKATDIFDRSVRPISGTPKSAVIPEFYRTKLKNGVEIIGTKTTEVPRIAVMINIEGGHLMEAEKGTKTGTAVLCASMMNEGTKNFTTEEISAQLDDLGSTIFFSSGRDNSSVYVEALTKNIDATLKILEEKLLRPGFREDDFKRIKKQALANIRSQKSNGGVTVSKVFNKLMYGETILGEYFTGTYNDVYKMKLSDVQSYYEKYYSPTVTSIVVVGETTKDEILPKLAFLNNWKAKPVKLPELNDFPSIEKTQIYLVHQSDFKTTASQIRIGYLAMPYDATGEFYKANVMNFALGGAFNSRINMNLREDKGFTYGARSGFSGSNYRGPFSASATVKSRVTDSTIVEFMKEIENFKATGITDEELAFTKSNILQRDVLSYETLFQKANYLSNIVEKDLPDDYKAQQEALVGALTKEDINILAKKHLKPENMVILVVGNKYLIKESLEALGYGKIKELDVEGN